MTSPRAPKTPTASEVSPPSAPGGADLTAPTASYGGLPGSPSASPADGANVGGLVAFGSSDAAVCEDGYCWVPDSSST